MIHKNAQKTWAENYRLETKTGEVGVEIEVEGDNLPREISGWVRKSEGSLRGRDGRVINGSEDLPDTPQEYVTNRPVSLVLLRTKLNNLHGALTREHVNVRLTQRASTHIHVNMLNETAKTMLGFFTIFAAVEPVLLRLCGPERNGNLFCLPCYETGDMASHVLNLSKCIIRGARGNWSGRRGKYASINTDPLVTFGSVEVRCFPNCIIPDTIHSWATWLVTMKEIARNWPDDTFISLIDRAYATPLWLTSQVFGNTPLYASCAPQHPGELITYGLEQAYEIAKASLVILDFNEETWSSSSKVTNLVYDDDGWNRDMELD